MSIPKGTYNKVLYDKIGKFYRTFFPGNGAALKFKGSDKLYTLKSIKTADPRWIFCTDRQTQLGDFLKDITKLETINGKPVIYDWSLNEMAKFKQTKVVIPPAYKKLLGTVTNFKQMNPSKECTDSPLFSEFQALVMQTEGVDANEATFKIKNMVRAEMDRQYRAVMRRSMNELNRTPAAFSVTMGELVQVAMDNGLDLAPYEPSEVMKGLQVELEHGIANPKTDVTHNDLLETLKIVLAHLEEMSDYYTQLERMERLNEKMIQKLESLTGKKVMLEGLEWEPAPLDNKDFVGTNNAGSLQEGINTPLPEVLVNYINNNFYVYDEDTYKGTITIEEQGGPLGKQKYIISYYNAVYVVPKSDNTKEVAARATELQNEFTKVVARGLKEVTTSTAGNYSTSEMESFLQGIINSVDFQTNQIRITIPSNYPSSSVNTTKEQVNSNWAKAKQIYGEDPTVQWFVWDASVGGSLNKPKELRSQRYDIQSILDIVSKYPESLRGLNIGVVSNSKNKMDQSISTQGD